MQEKKTKHIVDDKQLVADAQKNRDAFAALYDKYFQPIYLFVYKRVWDEAAAGDICQDAMLKAMFNIHKYEDRGVPFTAWLYRIASNEVNLYFRKQKKMFSVEIQEKHVQDLMGEIEISGIENEDEQEKLIEILNSIKPEYVEIIELRFFMQYSFREIAEFYDITEANAKMRLYRILDKLKKGWGITGGQSDSVKTTSDK